MSSNPYKNQLQVFMGRGLEVTVNRNGAPDVIGIVDDVNDDGCVIKSKNGEHSKVTFIAQRDIRGVSAIDWDLDNG